MLKDLPTTPERLIAWTWSEIEPYYRELNSRSIAADSVDAWLADWSSVGKRIEELYARLSVGTSMNTADKAAEERMRKYLDTIYPNIMAAEQTGPDLTTIQPELDLQIVGTHVEVGWGWETFAEPTEASASTPPHSGSDS